MLSGPWDQPEDVYEVDYLYSRAAQVLRDAGMFLGNDPKRRDVEVAELKEVCQARPRCLQINIEPTGDSFK